MRYRTPDNVPCVVCRENRPLPGSVYCGIHCRTVAYNFRKRINPPLASLGELGFSFVFNAGVLLRTHIAPELHEYYPKEIHQFEWPVEPDIASLNADHYWSELRLQLGDLVADFARWLMERDYHGALQRDLFYMFVRTAYSTDSFECADCHHRYIRSRQSQDSSTGLCHDCAIERIPF